MEGLRLSEIITKTSLGMFNSLPKTGKPNGDQWTVLSCIVQEENSHFEVVALGTGSKCIGRDKMSPKGDILNDSHSEVICRRAFLLYLYNQLDRALTNQTSIFTLNSSKFSLNADVRYHFFTTKMPCGDASIFPKCDQNDPGDVVCKDEGESKKRSADFDAVNSKKLKGITGDVHRTGAKCLEGDERQDSKEKGAGYHVTGVVRTKPGRGCPTLSVSCSDKLTKWCHLGVQGAILSIILEEPIYLSTFTVVGDTPFSAESLQRAFYNRIGNLELTPPYKKEVLTFQQFKDSVFTFQKSDDKDVCPSSIIWYKDCRKPEVAVDGKKQGVTKKNMNSESSRLKICKAEFMRRFKLLYQCRHHELDKLNYKQCKEKAESYQSNWKLLKTRLGNWPQKNEILLEFH